MYSFCKVLCLKDFLSKYYKIASFDIYEMYEGKDYMKS